MLCALCLCIVISPHMHTTTFVSSFVARALEYQTCGLMQFLILPPHKPSSGFGHGISGKRWRSGQTAVMMHTDHTSMNKCDYVL